MVVTGAGVVVVFDLGLAFGFGFEVVGSGNPTGLPGLYAPVGGAKAA